MGMDFWNIKGLLKRMFTGAQTPPEPEEAPDFTDLIPVEQEYYDKKTVVLTMSDARVSVYIAYKNDKLDVSDLYNTLSECLKNLGLQYGSSNMEKTIILTIGETTFCGAGSLEQHLENEKRAINRLADNVAIICEKWAEQKGYAFKPIDNRPQGPEPDLEGPQNDPLS